MNSEIYKIRISPEVLSTDIVSETYQTNTFGVYSAMTSILSGGTNGSSLLTGLTVDIVFQNSFNDLGYFTPFDGFILQKEVINNFIFTASTSSPYTVLVYNTSDIEFRKFLSLSNYLLNWGDGSPLQVLNETAPQYLSHTYSFSGDFEISLTQTNPWGTTQVTKTIPVPVTGATIPNPEGTCTFTQNLGNWSGIPINANFIFTGDSENTVEAQVSSTWTNVPFMVSGFTKSQITDLKNYGSIKYATNVPIFKNGQVYGVINEISSSYTAYTINGVDYYDYPDGNTIFFTESSGLTSNDIIANAITKQEVLLDIVSSPEIQTEIFIDRGKISAFEGLQRLGEVDNLGDLARYGYGFFKINTTI